MSATKFTFDREFQKDILALMTQRYDFLLMSCDLVQPDHFEDRILIWFFNTIKSHKEQFDECISWNALQNEFLSAGRNKIIKPNDFQAYGEVLNHVRNKVQSAQYVIDQLVRFCRRQAGRKAYLETASIMDTAGEDEWDDILEKIHEARNIGISYLNNGSWFFKEIQDRAAKRKAGTSGPVSVTGIVGKNPNDVSEIVDLDFNLGGGLRAEQMGVILGFTSAGKSVALCHMGKIAVNNGQKVVHYTLELSESDIATRYDANIAEVNFSELLKGDNNTSGALDAAVAGVSNYLGTKHCEDLLLIKGFPSGAASIDTLKSHLKMLEGAGWYPDLIVVDYLDLLRPRTKYSDYYQDLGSIAVDLRGIAGERKIPLWTATQTNRGAAQQEIVDLDVTGDSFRKVQVADIVLSMCANREERINNYMRLFIAKNRNGRAGVEVGFETKYEQMKFYVGQNFTKSAANTKNGNGNGKKGGSPPGMS